MEPIELSEAARTVDCQSRERPGAPSTHPALERAIRTIWRLRQSDGCPWDKEQTHASIRKNMIEEAYEAAEAIDEANDEHLVEELGDVLMQVLLHAQIAADDGSFDIDTIAAALNEKLVRRHPHVFGKVSATTASDALTSWNAVKTKEREAKAQSASHDQATSHAPSMAPAGLLNSVPHSLPALMQCQKLSERAAKAGFDWETIDGAWEQVAQEKTELDAETPGSEAWKEEFGDLLFSLVNVARLAGVNAEEALERSNSKFRRRWAAVEALLAAQKLTPEEASTAYLNELWVLVKEQERA